MRRFVFVLPLASCAIHHASDGPSAALSSPFTAEYLGAGPGLGVGCEMLDAPPFGGWTVVVRVADPRRSGLPVGKELCAVVHSPTLYLDGRRFNRCVWQVGSEPPLWACSPDGNPSGLHVFSEADAAALAARRATLKAQQNADAAAAEAAAAALLPEQRATLTRQAEALQSDVRNCPALRADAVSEVLALVKTLGPVAAATDFDGLTFQAVEPFVVDGRARLDVALAAAGCTTP